jgi:hypothetical protein
VLARRAAFADGSLTMITCGRGLERAEGLRLKMQAALSGRGGSALGGCADGGSIGWLVVFVAVRPAVIEPANGSGCV